MIKYNASSVNQWKQLLPHLPTSTIENYLDHWDQSRNHNGVLPSYELQDVYFEARSVLWGRKHLGEKQRIGKVTLN